MPRYFFTTDDGDYRCFDDSGLDLVDDEEARRYALDALPDMARDKVSDGERREIRVTVLNADGDAIYHASLTLVGQWLERK